MNDKIILTCKDFNFDSNLKKQTFTNYSLEKLRDSKEYLNLNESVFEKIEQIFESEKTYYNSKTFQVDYTVNKGLKVSFNPNKVMNIAPTKLLEYNQFKESFNLVESELSKIGVNLDITKQPIYRYDTSFDVKTQFDYNSYLPIITNILPNKTIVKRAQKKIYENSLYLSNTSTEITVYDKQKESNLNQPIIRFETRHKKIPSSKRFNLKVISESKYYQLRYKDKELIKNSIFVDVNNILLNNNALSILFDCLELNQNLTITLKKIVSYSLTQELQKQNLSMNDLFDYNFRNQTKQYKIVNNIKKIIDNYKYIAPTIYDNYIELNKLFTEVA